MRSLLFAALALVAAPVLAQDAVTLRPGHPDLMTSGLSLETETIGVRVTTPRVRELGSITTTVSRDGDTVTLVSNADVREAGLRYEATSTFGWPSLTPVSRTYAAGSVRGTTAYDGTHVTGSWGRGDWDPIPFDITLRTPAFQPEVLPLVARALPFREGYVATLPTFSSENRVSDYTLTVVGQEDYTRGDGSTASTWVVEQTGGGSALRASPDRRHYVDAETRALVATTFTASGTTEIVSEPVTEEAIAALDAETAAIALRPGLDRLEMDALTTYSQDYVIRVVQPVQQEAGTQSVAVTVDREAGTATLETSLEVAIAGQRTTETLVAAYPSLAPISNTTNANGTAVELTYSDAGVAGTITPADGEADAVDVPLEDAVFDAGWLLQVVRLLPFEEGYRATFHTVSPSEGPLDIALSVVDQEEIDGQTAWIVEAAPPEGAPTEFAVADGTRELLRMVLRPQAGVEVHIVPAE